MVSRGVGKEGEREGRRERGRERIVSEVGKGRVEEEGKEGQCSQRQHNVCFPQGNVGGGGHTAERYMERHTATKC